MLTTEVSRDPIQIGGKMVPLHGRFKLTCKKPADKFYLTNINSSVPKGKSIEHRDFFYDMNGKRNFLLIGKLVTVFKPDESDIDALNVAALIRHEDVRLEDMSEEEHARLVTQGYKKANCMFTLVNVDKSIMDSHDDNVEMIEISYLITNKKNRLTKKQLMYINSSLGLKTTTHIQDEKRYVASLQDQLISHLKVNKDKRKEFLFFYEKLNEAEVMYYINSFIENELVKDFGGMYKMDDRPIGFSIKDIKEWFATNEDEYARLKHQIDLINENTVKS